ncbi:hypothetical protein NOI24_06175 [Neorhizobium galegae]|uniref:hypothetical protein n=1 Tax=Neorhizobium galegae TaxID=399 RepID=UPI002103F854|nr:hypothetical protein [Neorhizobium galegae]MCQ1770875.1 hypothetical protein [Neorhizobium galegae]MCQ1799599.1 hypothetical protein [Neorhizobium galegae]
MKMPPRSVGILATAAVDLTRRLQALYPGQPHAYKGATECLTAMQSQCEQIYEQAETNKRLIQKAGAWTNWEAGLRRSIEWRATASGFVPQAESIIKNIENAIAEEQARGCITQAPTSPATSTAVAFRQRDRGWDAPPL